MLIVTDDVTLASVLLNPSFTNRTALNFKTIEMAKEGVKFCGIDVNKKFKCVVKCGLLITSFFGNVVLLPGIYILC